MATRQAISDAATRLFHERGFDQVTVDQIAEAADVGRKTVFNHFARKEDMFFDLDEAGRSDLLAWLHGRESAVSPLESLRLFAHQAVKTSEAVEGKPARGAAPLIGFNDDACTFVETMRASESLKARARAIRDELAELVAHALAESAGRPGDDAMAHLAATVLLATWTAALSEAHRAYTMRGDAVEAERLFLELIDHGAEGLKRMMAGTPYV